MRISRIDGYRAIAVIGVLWVHTWTFFGNPPISIGQINIAGPVSFVGTGVDLFFVISGFCMFLMYFSKQNQFSIPNYLNYLKKRYFRIAPVFYVAILVYSFFAASFNFNQIDWSYNLINASFTRIFFNVSTLYAPHFWSLATEWHFYLILPLIIFLSSKFGFRKMIVFCLTLNLLFRGYFWIEQNDHYNLINYSIFNRLVEFLFGIIVARIYLQKRQEKILNSKLMILAGFIIAFLGRILMSSIFQDRTDIIGYFSRVLNIPILTAGYSLMIINSLNVNSIFSKMLESKFFIFIGKISYSMYLWHWIIAEAISIYIRNNITSNNLNGLLITFFLSFIILIPISKLSYFLFESFYFKRKKINI